MKKSGRSFPFSILFYAAVFFSILTFALLQPFGAPPDEVNRYKVAQFICNHGTLPTGEEFEVAIGGYGGSYAFQPILPYIIQGFCMRLLSLVTKDNLALLLCARMVNVMLGVIMAVYVRKLSVLLFDHRLNGWLFCLLVMFLPQNLFLHSYVNTDSMASASGAVILYACVSGWKYGWQKRTCITLCAGIICCALSYYNAYGLIVTAILLFLFSHLKRDRKKRLCFQWRPLLRKGLMISVVVLAGIGWWFLRNYRIHDGDFLGLAAREANALRTALPQYSPATRVTLSDSGVSLKEMLFQMDFFYFLWNSFVARFGPMTLPTLPFLYIWYYRIFGFGWLFCLIPGRLYGAGSSGSQTASNHNGRQPLPAFLFHIPMLLSVLIPMGLCIYYSYTSDYQPQGRYIMPMLIPFMYYIALGFHKLITLAERWLPMGGLYKWYRPLVCGGLMLFLAGSLVLTLGGVVIPFYLSGTNLWNGEWIAF